MRIIEESELVKVESNKLNRKQLNFLLGETPKEHVYERPAKGGGSWKYVTGIYVQKVLNMMFGWDWDFETIKYEYDIAIGQVFVLGRLTVRTSGSVIIKTQFGRKDIVFKNEYTIGKDGKTIKTKTDIPLDLGNDLKAAATDSLKKCASLLGIASDVYAPNEFKAVKIIESNTNRAEELRNKITQLLENNQDTEEVNRITTKINMKESEGNADEEFYEEIIAEILSARL